MSHARTASQQPSRRRGGRNPSMAVDTRYARNRRRETPVAPAHDWRDWLIPAGVLSVLATIGIYHYNTLVGTLGALL